MSAQPHAAICPGAHSGGRGWRSRRSAWGRLHLATCRRPPRTVYPRPRRWRRCGLPWAARSTDVWAHLAGLVSLARAPWLNSSVLGLGHNLDHKPNY